jgi:cytochrome c553
MVRQVLLQQLAVMAAMLLPSIGQADSSPWLSPQPPGSRYPDGEEDRQYAILIDDLAHRPAFKRVAAETFRPEALIVDADRDPLDVILRRAEALLADIRRMPRAADLGTAAAELAGLRVEAAKTAVKDKAARRALFNKVCRVRRRIAFCNPLLDFKDLLFVKRQRSCINHMCDQYYGISQRPGGGVFILSDAFGPKPELRDLLADSVVGSGRLQGEKLTGGPRRNWSLTPDINHNDLHGEETQGGSFLSPALSYDGKTLVFAFVECQGGRNHLQHTDPQKGHWDTKRCYHLFQVGVDGKNLRQLTDGTWNDFQPCWMPGGRIAFISERRGGYLRCGRACPTYTVHDMAADGSDIRCLSFHETNEWSPSVTHDGMILYTRWDYVDRNANIAHHPWIMAPDGRDPRAVHGNFSLYHTRANMELDVRAIPASHRFVATAAPHHGQAFGSLVIIDPRIPDDDKMAPVKRLTPDVGFPETQNGTESYGGAWPLSENYYLCSYEPVQVASANPPGVGGPGDPAAGYPAKPFPRNPNPKGCYGLYLVDSFGNKELIYRDPDIGCHHPIPFTPRPTPPAMPEMSHRLAADQPAEATVTVANVYRSSAPWPAGTKITALRVYEALPQTIPSHAAAHTGVPIPNSISVNIARAVLGTVPVEEDGSAQFVVPARHEVFFQALDEKGLAITSMRSGTQFQPGEHAACQGCHEPRGKTPVANFPLLAVQRVPSRLRPDVDGTNPFSYPRLVQPVLEKNCVSCHEEKADKAPPLGRTPVVFAGWRPAVYYASYLSLAPKYGFYTYGADSLNEPKAYRTTPGEFGARASKLYPLLLKGHYGVKLSPPDMHRLTVWLDSCSLFYGVYEKEGQEAQLRGEIVRPSLE